MNVLAESNVTRGARRRAKTREAILDAAERAFTQHGFRGTKMEDVAFEADVAVGSIYSHFGNKDGLYAALVERAVERFGAYMQQAYQDEWTPLEQVMACGDSYLRFHLEHPGSFRFIAFEGVEGDGPVSGGDGVDALIAQFAATIQAAMDAGEARPMDARLAARFLWGAWNGTVALGLRRDGLALSETEIHDALQQARDIVLAGLGVPGHTARLRTTTSPE